MGNLAIQRLCQAARITALRSENGETIETVTHIGVCLEHRTISILRHVLRLEVRGEDDRTKIVKIVVDDTRHEGGRWFPHLKGTVVKAVVSPSQEGKVDLLVHLVPAESSS